MIATDTAKGLDARLVGVDIPFCSNSLPKLGMSASCRGTKLKFEGVF